jgi:hypothetical protein
VSELRKVTGPPSRADRNVWRLVALVLAAILLAVVKPWGEGPPSIGGVATPAPTASPSPVPDRAGVDPLSDYLTFGTREPPPGWELWPAGNLASFYFAMRIDMAAIPVTGPSGTPGPSQGAPTASPARSASQIPDEWPTIRIPAGSTLDLLGINHPVDYTVSLVAFHQANGLAGRPIHALLATSPWPDHFTIIGVSTVASDVMGPWPTGQYKLDLRIDPGGFTRSVDVVIDAAPEPSAVPSPTSH